MSNMMFISSLKVVEVVVEMVMMEFHEDGAFGGVGDEEVVVGEEEEALVKFMVEWFEEDEDSKKNGKDDLLIRKHRIKVEKHED
uniref:Uncharacterized protein n=1 Tax=Tanacetum cinerariifolium TaxID=118510 RepID=A0A6L2NE51_TANCI|nr:hypothetical protein [Tanacetum cinerariifolium]